jgi:hypothetical protein
LPSAAYTERSTLRRPESISCSRRGDRLLISNSDAASIGIFCLENRVDQLPRIRCIDRVQHDEILLYAHGAEFSPDESHALALGEYAHSLSAVRLTRDPHDGTGRSRIAWSIRGEEEGLQNPADLALHPDGTCLVIANRMPTGIAVLSLPSPSGRDPTVFSHSISVQHLNGMGLSAPHGTAFSPDGQYLFVTHKPFFRNKNDTGNSAVTVFDSSQLLSSSTPTPLAVRDYRKAALHHVAVHPTRPLIGITNSRGDTELLRWDESRAELHVAGRIDVYRAGEGAKGVEFTAEGRYLMVTTEFDEILFFETEKALTSC